MPETRPQRYPGIYSFAPEQSSLFFGRQADIARLLTLIEVEPQVLLYSRSGLGKTSLLNAGLRPRLEPEKWVALPVRFYAYGPGNPSPVQRVRQALQKAVPEAELPADTLLSQLEPGDSPLWFAFKQAQAQLGPEKRFALLFDQLEELFGYPEAEVEAFKQQLYELLQTPVPNGHMQQIMALRRENPERFSREALAALRQPLRLTPLYTIRTDRLALLDRLVDKLVGLREVFHELQPLDADGARRVIEQPAQQAGEFASPAFNFRPEAAAKILHFLSEEGQKAIESTQLQIICARIEAKMQQQGRSEVAVEDVPDFKNVFRDFYTGAIGQLPPAEQASASRMVEDELIRNAQRVSLDENICKGYVSQASLDQLVNARLLRREPNSVGGLSYELSHDTLMEPIEEVAETRRQEEALRAAEAEAEAERVKRQAERKRQRLIIGIISVALLVSVGFVVFGFYQRSKALEAKEEADSSLQIANDVLDQMYFYEDKFGLTFKKLKNRLYVDRYRYGYIDRQGREVIPFIFEVATPFNPLDGFARVKQNGQSFLLDTTGTTYQLATSLTNLGQETEALDLHEIRPDSLPDNIGKYLALRVILVYGAKLRKLPTSLGQLTKLQGLILFDNHLSNLPPQIGQLTQLRTLSLGSNYLSSLPPEIGKLTQLQLLALYDNDLNVLPSQIGQLTQLQWLNLGDNKLTILPAEIKQLKNLQYLNLRGNPLPAAEVEALRQALPDCEIEF